MTRPGLEVADVFRRHADTFLDRYGEGTSQEQRRVLHDVTACRTAELGGHVEQCDHCGHQRNASMLITRVLWGVFSNGE